MRNPQLSTRRLRGVLAPVVTPFKADLSPDPQRFIAHCQWLISHNCGLAVFGTNSEANSMSAEEREDLLDALIAAEVDPARMMPGTGCCSITETIRLTAHAVRHGCAGVLMLPPFYYKEVSQEGLFRYFSEVIQRVSDTRLRIYLYHIPPVAMVGITPKLVERLLKAYPGTIAGMKDSSGDWNNTKTFLDAFSGKTASVFDVFVGSETFLLANLRNGGVGCISATANVNPGRIDALCAEQDRINEINRIGSDRKIGQGISQEHTKAGTNRSTFNLTHPTSAPTVTPAASLPLSGMAQPSTASPQELQAKLDVVREVFARKSWPSMIAAMKQAIAIYRKDPEWARVRPPLVGMTTEQARLLARELDGIGFAMPACASS